MHSRVERRAMAQPSFSRFTSGGQLLEGGAAPITPAELTRYVRDAQADALVSVNADVPPVVEASCFGALCELLVSAGSVKATFGEGRAGFVEFGYLGPVACDAADQRTGAYLRPPGRGYLVEIRRHKIAASPWIWLFSVLAHKSTRTFELHHDGDLPLLNLLVNNTPPGYAGGIGGSWKRHEYGFA